MERQDGVLNPAAIARLWTERGKNTAGTGVKDTFILALLGGVFIGFGGLAFIVAGSSSSLDPVIGRLIGALAFPVGLMLIAFCGGQLFTGNNLLILSVLDGKIRPGEMFKNWGIVYLGNLTGAVLLAWLVFKSGLITGGIAEKAEAVALSKAFLSPLEAFLRGIGCNMLVVLAVWMQSGARELSGKIPAVWFPIFLFVFLGFEHCVANMFYLPLGMMISPSVRFSGALMNLFFVTLGNIAGGAGIIGCAYYSSYLKKKKRDSRKVENPVFHERSPREAAG